MLSEKTKLKPCKFCGGDPIKSRYFGPKWFKYVCGTCGRTNGTMWFEDKPSNQKKAIEEWNRKVEK